MPTNRLAWPLLLAGMGKEQGTANGSLLLAKSQ
jgi:hypothetical protein